MAGSHKDISKHVRLYMAIFAVLAVFTVITVAVATVHMSKPWNFVIGLTIAAMKASLVAWVFMHLKWDKQRTIWMTLGLCAVLFSALILLPVLTSRDVPPQAGVHPWAGMVTHDGDADDHAGH